MDKNVKLMETSVSSPGTVIVPVARVTRETKQPGNEPIAVEIPLTLIVNGKELVTMICSPIELKYLAIGFMLSEGLISEKKEIKRINIDERRGIARIETVNAIVDDEKIFKRIITPGCGRGAAFYSAADVTDMAAIDSKMTVSGTAILDLMKTFQLASDTYQTTHGVHSAALCDNRQIEVFSEDIGRHNAVDKIFGRCLWEDRNTRDKMIFTSGRISSEIIIKVARQRVPMVISKAVPTSIAVKLAETLGVTLVGFVRGIRMNVYTHDARVVVR